MSEPDWPNVWSGDQLFAWSGLDGPTDWENAVCARSLSPELGLMCDCSPPLKLQVRAAVDGQVYEALPGLGERAFGPVTDCRVGNNGFSVGLALDASEHVLSWSFGFVADDLAEGAVAFRNDGPAPAEVLVTVDTALALVGQPGPTFEPGEGLVAAPEAVPMGACRYTARLAAGPGESRQVDYRVAFRATAAKSVEGSPWRIVPTPDGWAGGPPAVRRARAKAVAVLRANVFAPEGNMPRRWMVTQRLRHRNLNTFHAPFLALGALAFDPGLAADVMWCALAQQQSNGMVPEQAWPRGQMGSVAPLLLCWGFWNLYHATQNLALLDQALPRLKDYVKYPLAARLLERLGHVRSHGARFLTWGLGEGSNMVNSPRFDDKEAFAAVDLTSYAVAEIGYVARMIEEVSPEHREAVHLGWMGEELGRETQEYFWEPEHGCFVDRYPDDDPVNALTVAGLTPLFCGVPTPEQAARMIQEHLLNPAEFWTAAPVASLAASDPRCDQNMWRGAMWPGINLLLVLGLRRYGHEAAAAELRERTIHEISRWYRETGRLWEYYDSAGERSPAEVPRGRRTGALPDYGWTAAAFLALLHDTAVV